MSQPRVSILVAAWNEREMIARHISSIRALRYPAIEYVLCAGGSDGTHEAAAKALAETGTLLRQERGEGKQRALRRCLSRATGQVVYFTDADCIVTDDAFERTLQPILAGAGAATGRSRPLPELAGRPEVLCAWAPQYVSEARQGHLSAGLLGRNCAVTRAALAAAGDLADDVSIGTDYHLARSLIRRGVPLRFVRTSFVETDWPRSISAYVAQQSRWLRNHWVHARATGDRPLMTHAVRTWALGWSVVALPVVAMLFGRWVGLVWLALLAHGTVSRIRYIRALGRVECLPIPLTALALAPLAFLIDMWAAARSLFDVVAPRWRGSW